MLRNIKNEFFVVAKFHGQSLMNSFENDYSHSGSGKPVKSYINTLILAGILILNLSITAAFLILWKFSPVNETNVHYAIIALVFLCILFILFILFAIKYSKLNEHKKLNEKVIEVQIVYPEPEQKYLTGTLLSKLLSSNGNNQKINRTSSRAKTITESLSSVSISRGASKSMKSVKSISKSTSSTNTTKNSSPIVEEPHNTLDHLSFSSCEEDNCS
uniref:Col_cuticle_N domain-containing protein n=1 Tax=Parastrongyloides trichosuri TaxID=131310 RepID=A0A0N5A3N1_PARTI